jgi:hypothetical protein
LVRLPEDVNFAPPEPWSILEGAKPVLLFRLGVPTLCTALFFSLSFDSGDAHADNAQIVRTFESVNRFSEPVF